MDNIRNLVNTVIENNYCVGCGACASVEDSPFEMKIDENGQYSAFLKDNIATNNNFDYESICPFSDKSLNETILGDELFSRYDASFNEYTGYYISNYAGFVKEGAYRDKGSSGGMGSWLANQLLEKDLVDAIIHVKDGEKYGNALFEYKISYNKEQLFSGAKSKYYPIEMSEVLKEVQGSDLRFAVIGIPCFIKSIRLLSKTNTKLKNRIKYCIGLVCGHLKSDFFAKAQGWEIGIEPNNLESIDFRVKLDSKQANEYGIEATGKVNDVKTTLTKVRQDLYTTNWGQGHFKYNACEYCDDVLSETADVTVGDAWLPEYRNDSNGTNIVVVRNPDINEIIEEGLKRDNLKLDKLTAEKIYESQAGGFRQRRDGLSYRLYLKDKQNQWRPTKRVEPSNTETKVRKKIYKKRLELTEKSFKAYHFALNNGEFNYYKEYMNKYIKEYNLLINPSFLRKIINRIL